MSDARLIEEFIRFFDVYFENQRLQLRAAGGIVTKQGPNYVRLVRPSEFQENIDRARQDLRGCGQRLAAALDKNLSAKLFLLMNAAGQRSAFETIERDWPGIRAELQAEAARKPQRARKPRRRAKRARSEPTVDMMRAYNAVESGITLRKVADELRVSHTTVSKWHKLAKEYLGGIPRSKGALRALPTDRRGGTAL